jgi:hypothetical protein
MALVGSRRALLGKRKPSLRLSASAVLEDVPVGTTVGVVTTAGVRGSPVYALLDDAGGKFAIDSSTGVVTVVSPLDYDLAHFHQIRVAVSGVVPPVPNKSFTILVIDVVVSGGYTAKLAFNDSRNGQYLAFWCETPFLAPPIDPGDPYTPALRFNDPRNGQYLAFWCQLVVLPSAPPPQLSGLRFNRALNSGYLALW